MKEKVFPVSMAFLWGIVFTQSMQSIVLGICMGLLMGITFGLFDSGKGEKEDEKKDFKMAGACRIAYVRRRDLPDHQ